MIVWLNPVCGLSGDMLLGALIDLGAPLAAIRECVGSTGLRGWDITATTIDAGGLLATRATVTVSDSEPKRRAAELLDYVRRARPAAVAELAATAVEAIARVEGELHGEPPEDVYLHEIGGLDTVVDTVGVAAALYLLGVTAVHCAPIALGTGTVATRHGILPLPAPATSKLLRGAQVVGADIAAETVTPTGAALLLAARARYGLLPPMVVARSGYGAGSRVLPDRPNVLPAIMGTPVGTTAHHVVLSTNVDDVTGEVLGHTLNALLDAGALDAWISPATMKKGRPGHVVHVLCTPEKAPLLQQVLLEQTGSLGVRRTTVERVALDRQISLVHVDGHAVRVKWGPWGAKPEYEDVAVLAAALGLSLREADARVRRAMLLPDQAHGGGSHPADSAGPPG